MLKEKIINRKDSFTSASSIPMKIFLHPQLVESLQQGRLIPFHVQISLTNICNLSCSWCSCADRNRKDELDFGRIKRFFGTVRKLGARAVTITGGGEPLLHRDINKILQFVGEECGIKIGLVTNGTSFRRISPESFKHITWCRISHSDTYEQNGKLFESYDYAVEHGEGVDFSFSYVLTRDVNEENLCNIVTYANAHDFTHIRLVQDLYLTEEIDLEPAKRIFNERGIDDSLVIYQDRKISTRGRKHCYISLLKPQIAANGKIYPCCGVQYALKGTKRDFPEKMQMGDMEEIEELVRSNRIFDGSVCMHCYYDNYNWMLERLINPIEHNDFI